MHKCYKRKKINIQLSISEKVHNDLKRQYNNWLKIYPNAKGDGFTFEDYLASVLHKESKYQRADIENIIEDLANRIVGI